jgi:hypothetical protein
MYIVIRLLVIKKKTTIVMREVVATVNEVGDIFRVLYWILTRTLKMVIKIVNKIIMELKDSRLVIKDGEVDTLNPEEN